MEENEKDFSPVESLQLITNMINNAKNRFAENGFLYLLWGWVVFICGLIQFILRHFYHYEKSYLVWIAIWPVIIYHFYYVRKRLKQKKHLLMQTI